MATRKRTNSDRLEEAMVLLIQNQATFLSRLSETDKELADLRREDDERFARVEEELGTIKTILLRQEQILQGLPEAIREKIGFKSQK